METGHLEGLGVSELQDYRIYPVAVLPSANTQGGRAAFLTTTALSAGADTDGQRFWGLDGESQVWFRVPRVDRRERVSQKWHFDTGAAPFDVTGTTKVTNLNADLLDDMNTATAATGSTVVARESDGRVKVADPVDPTDATNLRWIRAELRNADDKKSVKCASIAALADSYTLSANEIEKTTNGAFPDLDGVAVVVGDYFALLYEGGGGNNYYLGSQNAVNGLWKLTVKGDGSTKWKAQRAENFDVTSEVTAGAYFFIDQGTQLKNSKWALFTDDPVSLKTNAPKGVAAVLAAGGSLSANTYYYKVTFVDFSGKEAATDTEVSETTAGGNLTINLSWTSYAEAVSYRVYRTTTSGNYGASSLAGTTTGTTFSDTGISLSSGTPPTASVLEFGKIASNSFYQQGNGIVINGDVIHAVRSTNYDTNAIIFASSTTALSMSTNLTWDGSVITANGGPYVLTATAATGTNPIAAKFSNTGGDFYFGLDNSAGSNFNTGVAYSGSVWRSGNNPISFVTNSTLRFAISGSASTLTGTSTTTIASTSNGNIVLSPNGTGTLTATFAQTGNYAASTQQTVATFFNNPADIGSGVNSSFIQLQTTPNGGGHNPIARIGVVGEAYASNLSSFVIATRDGSGITERWSVKSSGILQSNGAQTIQTSSGDLTLKRAAATSLVLGEVYTTLTPETATNQTAFRCVNAGGTYTFGVENSAGNVWNTSPGAAYAQVIWNNAAVPICFVTNSVERFRISASASTLTGTSTTTIASTSNGNIVLSPNGTGINFSASIFEHSNGALSEGFRLYTPLSGDGAGSNVSWYSDTTGSSKQSIGFVGVVNDGANVRRGKFYIQLANDGVPGVRFTVDRTGNVGIGTTNPGAGLELSAGKHLLLTAADLTATNGAFDWTRIGTGIAAKITQSGSGNILQLHNGSTQLVTVINDGNVGIGTPSPARVLHVKGGSGTMQVESTSTSSALYLGDTASSSIDNQGVRSVGSSLALMAGGSDRLTILTGGNVGIGTTNPVSGLHVNSPGPTNITLSHDTAGVLDNDDVGGVSWRYTGGTGALAGNIFLIGNSNSGNDGTVRMSLGVRANDGGTSRVEQLTIQSTGNFGIGTTSPTYILSLGGNSARTIGMERHTTADTAGNHLTIQAGGATSGATNKSGGSIKVISGVATGNATSQIEFYTHPAGTSGTADTSATLALTIGPTQLVNAAIGFQVAGVAATGTILRGDGTKFVATTATYPATVTANRLIWASGTNAISDLATTADRVLVSTGGVPTWTLTMPAGLLASDSNPVQKAKYFNVGDASLTTITLTHNFGTTDVVVQVWKNSGNYDTIIPTAVRRTANTVVLVFVTAPGLNAYRAAVLAAA